MNSTNGSVRIGPISLFTLVIILRLAVMAVLSATTAQATYSAAEKQALFTNDTYQNEQAAQSAVARHRRGSGKRASLRRRSGRSACRRGRGAAGRRAARRVESAHDVRLPQRAHA